MKRWFLAVLLAAMPAAAQFGQPGQPDERVQKIVQLKYADPNAVQNLLQNFGVETRADVRLKSLALSGQRNRVTTAEDAIKQLDVPGAVPKDVELTVYFLVGSDTAPPSASLVPQDMQSTVTTLKTTFPFKTYYLLDTLSLQVRSGSRADTTGQLTAARYTSFRIGSANVEGDGKMIRLDGLHAGLRIPHTVAVGKIEYTDTGITTEVVDVKEGQKLVLGRSSLEGPSTALFLVLIAKVVN